MSEELIKLTADLRAHALEQRANGFPNTARNLEAAADTLEGQQRAWMAFAAEQCEIERDGYELHPKTDTSRTGENRYIVGYQDACADLTNRFRRLAEGPVTHVVVPVEPLELWRRVMLQNPGDYEDKCADEMTAMLTAARKQT